MCDAIWSSGDLALLATYLTHQSGTLPFVGGNLFFLGRPDDPIWFIGHLVLPLFPIPYGKGRDFQDSGIFFFLPFGHSPRGAQWGLLLRLFLLGIDCPFGGDH